MPTTLRPTGVERTFGADEVIVTKTDLQGRITYANDVFCRVSAYPESEMLGSPHNMIRHPEMPRGVFRLLWQTLAEGREIFAYVVNLASDGAHYWVLAHVTPSLDAAGRVVGYHSNRRLPDPQAIRAVQPVYQRMLLEERRFTKAPEAAAAGLALLEAHLADLDTSYDELVWSLTSRCAA
ncbi:MULTISPECIES: PAS domain-containing protein [unclassified Nocardioides]|uniref:PAS domain-containing protein n=1 Tax=unclassified Nocardioides TaxID=2615069 RepID=UPI00301572D7